MEHIQNILRSPILARLVLVAIANFVIYKIVRFIKQKAKNAEVMAKGRKRVETRNSKTYDFNTEGIDINQIIGKDTKALQ